MFRSTVTTWRPRPLARHRLWTTCPRTKTPAAGPASNLILFLLLLIPLHAAVGWIDPQLPVTQWTNLQIFVAAVAFLQLFAVILNLFPVPPLDGFGIIGPWLDVDCVTRMSRAAWWGLRTAARPG